jgi:ABC-type branched-subunit amino acid transport system substrate-binding protein
MANQELRWGLKAGQVLTIPKPGQYTAGMETGIDSLITISAHMELSRYQCDSIASLKILRPPVKVALLLPFYADEDFSPADSLPENIEHLTDQASRMKKFRQQVSVELYEGTLLALDSLRNLNHNISLFVYDTKTDTNIMKKILRELEIVEPDLIIGPISPENIALVSKFSFERKVPLIPPILPEEALLKVNPFLFRIMPDENSMLDKYAGQITTNPNEHVVLIYKSTPREDKRLQFFKDRLTEKLKPGRNNNTVLFNEVALGDHFKQNLIKALKKDTINNIIIYSTYEPDVINALSNVHSLLREYQFRVFGFPAWQKFDNIRVDVIHEMYVTVYSPFFIDYNDRHVKNFISKSRNKLGYEPYKTTSKGVGINYTYLGYDLTMYFAQAMNKYGKNTCNCIEEYTNPQLLSDYVFRNSPNLRGFVNTSMSILSYRKDFEIEKTVIR